MKYLSVFILFAGLTVGMISLFESDRNGGLINENLPMLQIEPKDYLLCIGNGRIINNNLCGWCHVTSQRDAINCFNQIGGTQK